MALCWTIHDRWKSHVRSRSRSRLWKPFARHKTNARGGGGGVEGMAGAAFVGWSEKKKTVTSFHAPLRLQRTYALLLTRVNPTYLCQKIPAHSIVVELCWRMGYNGSVVRTALASPRGVFPAAKARLMQQKVHTTE